MTPSSLSLGLSSSCELREDAEKLLSDAFAEACCLRLGELGDLDFDLYLES